MPSVCGQNSYAPQSKFIILPAGATIVYQQHKQIGPAPGNRAVTSILAMNGANMMSNFGSTAKRKNTYNSMSYGEQMPSIARRNARERNRVKEVNNGFANLRQHIPSAIVSALTSGGGRGDSKKLSKVDTLRMALEYIRGLQDLIDDCDSQGLSIVSVSPSSSYYSTQGSADEFVLQNSYSEASVSPSPSYVSISNSSEYMQLSSSEDHMQFKFEPLDSYDNPNDEEILDYISLWQEQ